MSDSPDGTERMRCLLQIVTDFIRNDCEDSLLLIANKASLPPPQPPPHSCMVKCSILRELLNFGFGLEEWETNLLAFLLVKTSRIVGGLYSEIALRQRGAKGHCVLDSSHNISTSLDSCCAQHHKARKQFFMVRWIY